MAAGEGAAARQGEEALRCIQASVEAPVAVLRAAQAEKRRAQRQARRPRPQSACDTNPAATTEVYKIHSPAGGCPRCPLAAAAEFCAPTAARTAAGTPGA